MEPLVINSTLHFNNGSSNNSYSVDDAQQTVNWMRFLFYQIFGFPISMCGILGNILSIITWTRREMSWGKTSTPCYLIALSTTDSLYLLFINFGVILPTWLGYDSQTGQFYSLFKPESRSETFELVSQSMINVLANMSIYLIVAFTTERYIAVNYPMKGRVWCTPSKAQYVIVAVCLTVALLHIPDYMEKVPMIADLGITDTPSFQYGYNFGIMVLCFAVIPLIVLVIINSLLIRTVLDSQSQRAKMSMTSTENKFSVLTVTIISVVVVFFICHTPAAIILSIYTCKSVASTISVKQNLKWHMAFVPANFLSVFNSSINFILYSAISKRFRKTVFKMFCKVRYHNKYAAAVTTLKTGYAFSYPQPAIINHTEDGSRKEACETSQLMKPAMNNS